MTTPGQWFNRAIAFAGVLLFLASGAVKAGEILPPGFRPLPLGVHALVGGRVVIKPGEALESGTIVIRDGLIQAVGKDAAVPADARVWDMKGTTIYAGFIEPYLILDSTNAPISTSVVEPIAASSFTAGGVRFFGAPGDRADMGNPGAGNEIAKITPEFRAIDKYSPKDKSLEPLRELGFTTGVIAPAKGIIRGTGALVALVDENPNRTTIRPDVFQHIAFEAGDSEVYPTSLMGVIAAIRQSFFDAHHYALDRADYTRHPEGRQRPEFDPSLEALGAAANKNVRVVFEPGSALMDDRAAQLAAELGLDFCLVSCGQEWRRPDLAAATGTTFIVPLNFPTLPKLPDDDDWDQVSLDQLRAWDWAAENPALLRRQGREIALTTYGLNDKKDFRRNLRLALDRGLSETDALAALTTLPAKLCGVQSQLGTVEAGKFADLTVVEGTNYFDADARIRAVWIDGRIYPASPEDSKGKAGGADATEGKSSRDEPEKTPRPPSVASQTKPAATATNAPPEKKAEEKKDGKKDELRQLQKTRVARSPLEGRGAITNPPAVLIHNATIWTCATNGILENEDILVVDGKIKAVGRSSIAEAAEHGALMIVDGSGLHVTPGVIDCHSHTAILGDVNESALPSTAMVRISDVVNSETENFYQQLAGGVTMVNLLHGSANAIGGQNCVIKLRDGDSPEQLIFSSAPAGIKFALGENVKQSNWGEKFVTRFPQSRMGVRTFIQNRFIAAQTYLKEWEDYQNATNALGLAQTPGAAANEAAGRIPLPPRRDLELEAIGEIIQGKRLIHCHSYRQDEILMLLRLMPEFGVQIGTFQHVLEGYKIADEIAQHGAGGSTFSDWWAYKFEVYDAIPYNGSLMRERGVVVSFNSDSSELARRLYLEAAKAVKYGDTPEVDALDFVTLNPAKQLRIDNYVGSLEPGKDADFAIWSKSPLASDTVCLQTWIDGKKYFDRALETDRVARLKKERDDLIARAKKIAKLAAGGDDKGDDDGKAFFRVSLEHQFDGVDRDCMGDDLR